MTDPSAPFVLGPDAAAAPERPVTPLLDGSEELAEVEALMARACAGERFDRLGAIASEHLSTGGKRLRARLALAAHQALGGLPGLATPWAAACELLHNASLLHDDIQDGDRARRGAPTAWVRHGVAQAINAGDLLLILPHRLLGQLAVDDGLKWALAARIAEDAERLVRGQALELDLRRRGRLDGSGSTRATEGKTAALFGLPVEGAALLAGRTAESARQLAAPFRRLGLLFQLQDDVLDLYGDKGRDQVGSDLYEGKVSALVVEHLRLHPADTPWLRALLAAPRERTDSAQVDHAIAAFLHGGALDAVWARMQSLSAQIRSDPHLGTEPRLHDLAAALVDRALAPIAHTAVRPAQEL